MPPRWLCIVIVAFWLAVTGWLFCHDLLPRLLPGQPPVYAIELVEEAQNNRADANWLVHKDGGKDPIARATTSIGSQGQGVFAQAEVAGSDEEQDLVGISRPRQGVFELVAKVTPAAKPVGQSIPPFLAEGILVHRLRSAYRVNETGELTGLWAMFRGKPELPSGPDSPDVHLWLEGKVHGVQMTTRLQGEITPFLLPARTISLDLPRAPIGRGEAVLMPLHPVNRHRGLIPGQTWQVYLLDPLAWYRQAVGAMQGITADLHLLHARVRSEEEWFRNARNGKFACLVIDYQGDDVTMSTWVARKTGLVVKQIVTLDRTTWELERE
jgi:hypothetical protein